MMINPIGCLLGIFLSIFAIGLVFVAFVFNKVKGFFSVLKSPRTHRAQSSESTHQEKKQKENIQKNKVFDDNEGEYIDFEEV